MAEISEEARLKLAANGKRLDQSKLASYLESLKSEQRMPVAIGAGLGAALVSALLWAAITVATGYQIGYMALAVGFIVGFAVRFAGKGIDTSFGVVGAAMALLGCFLGNVFSIVGVMSSEIGLGYADSYRLLGLDGIFSVMGETFGGIDLLFYGIALFQGFKLSFRQLSEEEILEHASVDIETQPAAEAAPAAIEADAPEAEAPAASPAEDANNPT